VKLLGLEARQNSYYYQSRYRQVADLGVDLFVLNGTGTEDLWPSERYRLAGGQHVDELIRAAKAWHAEENFDGVLTFSESGVIATAAVADALGLPGIGVEAARTSRNKLLMRDAHRAGGVRIPRYRFVVTLDEALAAGTEFGYPVILKPTLGAASNFVFKVDSPAQMRERHAQASTGIGDMSWFTMEADGVDLGAQGLLVESFLDGHEHLIEALVWDDEVYLGSIVDRVTVEGDTFDDDVHHAPTGLSPAQLADVYEVVSAGVRAQGLRRSVMHAEVRFHEGKANLLEIAVRPGGGGLDYMARISAGHDPIRAVADVAAGVRPDIRHFTPTGTHTFALCLLCPAGTVASVTVPPAVAAHEQLYFLKVTARPGQVIRRPPHGNDIVGGLGALGTSYEDARDAALDLAGRVRVELS
jgi:biotin carboxylase